MGASRVKVLKRYMQKIANGIEIVLSIFVAVILILLVLRMILSMPGEAWAGEIGVQKVLEEALEIAIGVEFIKMLCLHTPGTVLEVLLFAIARHMIVKENTAVETLLGIVAIAVIFAIHKFLLVSHKEVEHMSFKASSMIGFVNHASGLDINEPRTTTIGDYLTRKLTEKGEEIAVGASISRKNYNLRVEKMDEGKISRVEVTFKE